MVVGGIAGGETEVVVFKVNGEVRVDEFLFDVLPNYSRHFVAVELDDGVFDLDFSMPDRRGSHCPAELVGSEAGMLGFGRLCGKLNKCPSDVFR